MYVYKTWDSESTAGWDEGVKPQLCEVKKCKGIKKCVVQKMISFEDYKACLFSGETSYRSQLMFRSLKHEVRTLEVNKSALNRNNDKRKTINVINSLARGHHHAINNLYI